MGNKPSRTRATQSRTRGREAHADGSHDAGSGGESGGGPPPRAVSGADLYRSGIRTGSGRGSLRVRSGSAFSPLHDGIYKCSPKWNGTSTLVVRDGLISWKNVNISFLAGDAAWSCDSGGDHVLTLKVYVPWQTSQWAQGEVGLDEMLTLRFAQGGDGKQVKAATFQRTKEGALPCKVEYVRAASNLGEKRLQPQLKAGDRKNEEEECPICFEPFGTEAGQVKKCMTQCNHAFCVDCVVSALGIRPPSDSGACPLCRREVTLASLYFAHNREFLKG